MTTLLSARAWLILAMLAEFLDGLTLDELRAALPAPGALDDLPLLYRRGLVDVEPIDGGGLYFRATWHARALLANHAHVAADVQLGARATAPAGSLRPRRSAGR